jgi:hypothetical protein
MKDLEDREQWVVVVPSKKPTSMLKDDWEKLERKESMI